MEHFRNKVAYQKSIYDFAGLVWIRCPKCDNKAVVKTSEMIKNHPFIDEVRASCVHCGWNQKIEKISRRKDPKQKKGNMLIYGVAADPYFHYPLWLIETFRGQVFWAYNPEHLLFLESHVAAILRERNGFPYQVRSIGARLPRWMTAGKNRKEVLQLISKLKKL